MIERNTDKRKEKSRVKTYPVPFAFGEIKKSISIASNAPSKSSKEEIINKARDFHKQGNIKEAKKYYQLLIKEGCIDHRVYSNYGSILKGLGKLQEAEIFTRKAIDLKPDSADLHSNLGMILKDLYKLQEAELSTRKAIYLKPDFAIAHSNLGIILRAMGKLQEAEVFTRKAIKIKPDYANAHCNLGFILEDMGRRQEAINHWTKGVEYNPEQESVVKILAYYLCFEEKYELALKYLSRNKSNTCQSSYLGCLLSLDREKDFNEKYQELFKNKACNADLGGIVAHANIIYKNKYESPFCDEAIEYILIDKINEESFSTNNLNKMISYIKSDKSSMKSQGILKGGVQTSGNLFSLDFPFVKSIKKALEEKIDLYKNKFRDSGQGFIKNWPVNYELQSWIINMKSGGYLEPHNHEYGWITGSFYLQIPKYHDDNVDSGNIAFSYRGPRYPNKNKNFNLTVKKIETRDICIFPSSLFHHTIPFRSKEERICFVFDLVQR